MKLNYPAKIPVVYGQNKTTKIFKSPEYNYLFNKIDGSFARWGKTKEDDPKYSPYGPEILDIEVGTICHRNCSWCYKSNTSKGLNMSLETFKKIFALMPPTLTQIAFGVGSIDSNPELFDIMDYTREQGVIPNITINGSRMTDRIYGKLAETCGAVSVSNYGKDVCYGAIKKLADASYWANWANELTLKQINIHQLLCEETYDECMELMKDSQSDPRLKNLNAIVFLIMKPKGKRNKSHQLRSASKYKALIDYAIENKIRIGFDSCTANEFIRAISDRPEAEMLTQLAEPCESTCFSLYVDVLGKSVPCSFCEGEPGMTPINILEIKDFMKEVWFAPETVKFRTKLLEGKRKCPVFNLEMNEE